MRYLAAVLVLFLFGCGGGDSETPQSTPQTQAPIILGVSSSYAIVANPTVTLNGSSVVNGNIAIGPDPGLKPTAFIGTGTVFGAVNISNNAAALAQNDAIAAMSVCARDGAVDLPSKDLTTLPSPPFGSNNGVFKPGLYRAQTALTIAPNGIITLDAQGDANAVFIFQGFPSLTVGDGSTIVLVNGAQAKNVWWTSRCATFKVTIGANAIFNGNVISYLDSITVSQNTNVTGRLFSVTNSTIVNSGSIITVPR